MTLSELTDGRYKIVLDDCWSLEHPEVREPDSRWYERILCKGGAFIAIYCEPEPGCLMWEAGCPLRLPDCRQHGDTIFKLWTSRPKNALVIWEKIKEEGSCCFDPMDGEANIFFPARLVFLAGKLAGARRKRRLSVEARARLAEVGEATRFLPQNNGTQSKETAQTLTVFHSGNGFI
jgi:hypothetical protein